MRPRGVAALAFDLDSDAVGRRHQRAGAECKLANGQAGIIVHAVDFLDGETVHQAVLDHLAAAATALLRGLKDDHRGAGEVARLGEIFCSAKQHGGVAVMAARVHLAGNCGLVGKIVGLLDGQRIHVGAQADRAVAGPFSAMDHPHHASLTDPRDDLVAAEAFKLLGDHPRRAMDVEEQLGMGVDIVPPGGDFRVQVGDTVEDRHLLASLRLLPDDLAADGGDQPRR